MMTLQFFTPHIFDLQFRSALSPTWVNYGKARPRNNYTAQICKAAGGARTAEEMSGEERQVNVKIAYLKKNKPEENGNFDFRA